MNILLSILIAGLVTGSIYALVASGLSLVWGTVGVFNFAQGALQCLGRTRHSTLEEMFGDRRG